MLVSAFARPPHRTGHPEVSERAPRADPCPTPPGLPTGASPPFAATRLRSQLATVSDRPAPPPLIKAPYLALGAFDHDVRQGPERLRSVTRSAPIYGFMVARRSDPQRCARL